MYNSLLKETQTILAKIWSVTHNVSCPALPKIFVPQPFSPVAPFFTASKSDKMLTSKATKSVAQELDDTGKSNKALKAQYPSLSLKDAYNQYESSINLKT